MGSPRRVSVFVPAYNEVQNLGGAVRDIVSAAEAELEDYEILLVDDGSTDRTGELADQLEREYPKIRAIHQERNLGIAAAYVRALDEAKMDYFSFLPADQEISAASIRNIFAAVGAADIVVPYHQNSWARPLHRRLLTRASTFLVNILFRLRLKYFQGPCIYPTQLARALPRTAGGFYFLTEMLVHAVRAGHTYAHVGLIHQERAHGKSKAVSLKNILRALKTIGVLWWAVKVRNVRPLDHLSASANMGTDRPRSTEGAIT